MKGVLNKLKHTLDKAVDKPETTYLFGKEFALKSNIDMEADDLSNSDSDDFEAKREAREYIRAFLQVENESKIIKDKVGNKRDWKYGNKAGKDEELYDISKWDRLEHRENRPQNLGNLSLFFRSLCW